MDEVLIRIGRLSKYFPLHKGAFSRQVLKAVDDVSFDVRRGEVVVLMGESGCGKTTCGLTAMRLFEPTSGEVLFKDKRLFSLRGDELRSIRQDMQVVLQNPLSSLDPRVTIRRAIEEPLVIHRRSLRLSREEVARRVSDLAEIVGLREEELDRYPRNLSGGQQQRACICRALALRPSFLVMDEPTSALDVSVQARVLNLLLDLREGFGMTYLFITHGAAVARYIGQRVVILYLGQVVEQGRIDQVLDSPLHPYTRALMNAVLSPYGSVREKAPPLEGAPESATELKPGCVFEKRCREKGEECATDCPDLIEVCEGHFVRCHRIGSSGQRPTWIDSRADR